MIEVTPEMIRAAQAATECDPAECDECIGKALAAALAIVERDAAAAEKEFVDSQVAQAGILGWRMDAGVTDLQVSMAMETAAGLVGAAKTFLTVTGAENYVEQHVHDRETGERYTLTIQRPGMRTPHELRRAAEAERDALRAELDRLTNSPKLGGESR